MECYLFQKWRWFSGDKSEKKVALDGKKVALDAKVLGDSGANLVAVDGSWR